MSFMVFVEGKQAPMREHETLEEARVEAERLATGNEGRRVLVLSVVAVLEPIRGHRWRDGALPVPDLPKVDPPAPWPTPGNPWVPVEPKPWGTPKMPDVVYYGCQSGGTTDIGTTGDASWYGEGGPEEQK
jgi:hypothetical protein